MVYLIFQIYLIHSGTLLDCALLYLVFIVQILFGYLNNELTEFYSSWLFFILYIIHISGGFSRNTTST